jgi:8-oxo-dGTP pyrophosphatase MutT (NUDIX family)
MARDASSAAQQIALWADKLRDISALGLRFAGNRYDRDHYRGVQEIAMAMLALATDTSLEELEPLRAPIFDRPTPMTTGDAAVIDDQGRILLIRRADNGLWAMPGGALEVGETPAEGTAREALEETGVRCEPVALVGAFDSRLRYSLTSHHLYQFVFLCRPLAGVPQETPSHDNEVLDVRWFPEHGLPSDMDPGHVPCIPHVYRVWHGDGRAFFDRQDAPQAHRDS